MKYRVAVNDGGLGGVHTYRDGMKLMRDIAEFKPEWARELRIEEFSHKDGCYVVRLWYELPKGKGDRLI